MFDLIQMHKLITNIGHVKCNYRQPEVNPERKFTRSQTDSLNITKERSNLETRKNFFTVRTADIWNSLPSDIKSIRQVTKFKIKTSSVDEREKINQQRLNSSSWLYELTEENTYK